MEKEFDPGAKFVEKIESDPRDIKAYDILGEPTDEEEELLPEKVDLSKYLKTTYDQGCVPACTSFAKAHENMIRQSIDYGDNNIEMFPEEFRVNPMGHEYKCEGEEGDTLENNLKNELKYGFPGKRIGEDAIQHKFFSEKYSYVAYKQSDEDIVLIKYRLAHKMPLYMACRGNKTIRKELMEGELKTTIKPAESTGGHAFICIGYDSEYFYFANSWKHNSGDKCLFKMKHSVMVESIKKSMFYWRFWITYDIEDSVEMFPDYDPDISSEEYKAVERAKESLLVNGVRHSDGKHYLEPHRPLTRLEMILILYRQQNGGKNS